MEKKTFLFVDGSNLYGSQYDLFGPAKYLNFGKLIQYISSSLNVKFQGIYFYASYSPKPEKPTKKQISYLKNEGLFYREVKNTDKVTFFKGYRSKTSGKEKEVDVKLAVDIVDFAHRKKYDKMFLLSGDADFLHALLAVNALEKDVNVICMPNNVLFRALIHFKTVIINFDHGKNVLKGYLNKPTFLYLISDDLTKKA